MAAAATSEVNEGPVLSFINKRLRALRKKQNRIAQMEEAIAQGKTLVKEQEEVLKSKPSVSAAIDELEKLRQPLAVAVAEEISLAIEHHHQVSASSTTAGDSDAKDEGGSAAETESEMAKEDVVVEDLLNLLYFGTMFDVKNQNDFTSTMLTRTHERGCCLTYDYVTDDEATSDLLGERDLDLISMLGGLLISRPMDSRVSHKNALQHCVEHAKQWLAHSDQLIDPDSEVTYAGLRTKLNKIMASDYFTTSPEMKATVEMAAAAAGNYSSFQMPVPNSLAPVSQIQVESSHEQYNQKEVEGSENSQTNGAYDNLSSPEDEPPRKDEFVSQSPREIQSQTEQGEVHLEEQNQRDVESKEQHHGSRRNQRGGRGGGGRRGFPNGRGGRGSSRGGGPYQNGGRGGQYYDQAGNFFPRSYHNNRGRGGRGGSGGNFYNNHSSGGQAAYAAAAES